MPKVKKMVEVEVDVPETEKVESWAGLVDAIRGLMSKGTLLPDDERRRIQGRGADDLGYINTERDAAWAVLTAMRGPDGDIGMPGTPTSPGVGQFDAKYATTAIIRGAVSLDIPGDVNADAPHHVEVRKRLDLLAATQRLGVAHFVRHAQAAFKVLGLKWDEVNT